MNLFPGRVTGRRFTLIQNNSIAANNKTTISKARGFD